MLEHGRMVSIPVQIFSYLDTINPCWVARKNNEYRKQISVPIMKKRGKIAACDKSQCELYKSSSN